MKAMYFQCLCEILRQLGCLLLRYCFYKKMVENCRRQQCQ